MYLVRVQNRRSELCIHDLLLLTKGFVWDQHNSYFYHLILLANTCSLKWREKERMRMQTQGWGEGYGSTNQDMLGIKLIFMPLLQLQSNTMLFNNASTLIQSLTSLIFLPLQNMYLMCTCVYVNLWTQVRIKLHSHE